MFRVKNTPAEVLAIVFLCCGCTVLRKNVYLPDKDNGKSVVTQWNSCGDYNVKGKTFVLSPADGYASPEKLYFGTFAGQIEKSLVYSGAVKANDGQPCDMRIMLDYKSCRNSYLKETFPNSHASPFSSSGYISPTYAYRASMGIITGATEYDHFVNLYALDGRNCECNDTLWSIEAYTLKVPEQFHEVIPFMAYSLRNEYGLSSQDTRKENVFALDYMFRLYYNDFLSQPNVVEWPECKKQNADFKVAFVAKYDDETFVCIRKTKGGKGNYSFGPSIYLEVSGNRIPGSLMNADYTLGDKIWNEYGTRYFVFRFPVNVMCGSVISMYEENQRGKRGKEWLDIRIK